MAHLAKSWHVASGYPWHPTTGPVHYNEKDGISGASLVATDGTPPLRCLLRVLVNPHDTLWHSGSNQSGFMPEHIHITHICFYACDRQYLFTHDGDCEHAIVFEWRGLPSEREQRAAGTPRPHKLLGLVL